MCTYGNDYGCTLYMLSLISLVLVVGIVILLISIEVSLCVYSSQEADRRNALDMATDETLDLEKQVEKLRVEVDDANENIKRLFLLLFQVSQPS